MKFYLTAQKQRIIVESNMVQDNTKLGAKRPQSKSLSCAKLRGFFYGGSLMREERRCADDAGSNPARQHLILQTICAESLVDATFMVLRARRFKGTTQRIMISYFEYPVNMLPLVSIDRFFRTSFQNLFYDNPSSKRSIL